MGILLACQSQVVEMNERKNMRTSESSGNKPVIGLQAVTEKCSQKGNKLIKNICLISVVICVQMKIYSLLIAMKIILMILCVNRVRVKLIFNWLYPLWKIIEQHGSGLIKMFPVYLKRNDTNELAKQKETHRLREWTYRLTDLENELNTCQEKNEKGYLEFGMDM